MKPSSVNLNPKSSVRRLACLLNTIPTERTMRSKGFFYDFSFLRIYESNPQRIRERRGINFGGETSDETDLFVFAAGVKELSEGGSCGLDIHIEKRGFDVGILVTNRLDQPKGISATDLGAVKVSNGFVPAPTHWKKAMVLGSIPSEGRERLPRKRSISSRSLAVITFLCRPYPYSTFWEASKGSIPAATTTAETSISIFQFPCLK